MSNSHKQAVMDAGDRRDWDECDRLEAIKPVAASAQPTLTNADIKAQKAQRLQLCAQAIQEVLAYYECDLVAVPYRVGGEIKAKTELVLK